MTAFSVEELAVIVLLLDEEEKESEKKMLIRVHKAWKKRATEGEYLLKELMDDETKFHEYFRMYVCIQHFTGKNTRSFTKARYLLRKAVTPRSVWFV
jgi:hypothetical protein